MMDCQADLQTNILLQEVLRLLRVRKLTIGFAESCTGGLLTATMTAAPGVSDVFMGSVVTYSNAAKVDVLGVSEEALKAQGAVSELVAREMAQGTRRQMKVDVAIAITGIAGPTGGTPDKPVGTVCFAMSGPGIAQDSVRKQFSGTRNEVQDASVRFAMEYLVLRLKS